MPLLLDLFCGAGGAGMGYARAGFDVVGVDNEPQPNYPFDFVQDDAIAFAHKYIREFDACHASPPCQAFTTVSYGINTHQNLIPDTREVLAGAGIPTVIENVIAAPIERDVMLCGTMFGLRVFRHRYFEVNVPVVQPRHAVHSNQITWLRSESDIDFYPVYGHGLGTPEEWRGAMGIDWMQAKSELAEAIPPAYTEYIGNQILCYTEELVG
jgi:DNA (cytosine-5)-methyltransferase 1